MSKPLGRDAVRSPAQSLVALVDAVAKQVGMLVPSLAPALTPSLLEKPPFRLLLDIVGGLGGAARDAAFRGALLNAAGLPPSGEVTETRATALTERAARAAWLEKVVAVAREASPAASLQLRTARCLAGAEPENTLAFVLVLAKAAAAAPPTLPPSLQHPHQHHHQKQQQQQQKQPQQQLSSSLSIPTLANVRSFRTAEECGATGGIDRTRALLQPLCMPRPVLSDKLLARPPFRFLHDIFSAVLASTGFGEGLLDASQRDGAAVAAGGRAAKLNVLRLYKHAVGLHLGTHVAALPAHVVAGTDAPATNVFLQLLALAATDGASCEPAVAAVRAGSRQLGHDGFPSPLGLEDADEDDQLLLARRADFGANVATEAAVAETIVARSTITSSEGAASRGKKVLQAEQRLATSPMPPPPQPQLPPPLQLPPQSLSSSPIQSLLPQTLSSSSSMAPQQPPRLQLERPHVLGRRARRPCSTFDISLTAEATVGEPGFTILSQPVGEQMTSAATTAPGLGGAAPDNEHSTAGNDEGQPEQAAAGRLARAILAEADGVQAHDGSAHESSAGIRMGRLRRAGAGDVAASEGMAGMSLSDLRSATSALSACAVPLRQNAEAAATDALAARAELTRWENESRRALEALTRERAATALAMEPYVLAEAAAHKRAAAARAAIAAVHGRLAANDARLRAIVDLAVFR